MDVYGVLNILLFETLLISFQIMLRLYEQVTFLNNIIQQWAVHKVFEIYCSHVIGTVGLP